MLACVGMLVLDQLAYIFISLLVFDSCVRMLLITVCVGVILSSLVCFRSMSDFFVVMGSDSIENASRAIEQEQVRK